MVLRRIFGPVEKYEKAGESCSMNCIICTAHQIVDDQINKEVIGKACSTFMREEKCIQDFGGKTGGRRMLVSSRERWMENVTDLKSYNGRI